jgi:PAS domain S-box-containing protein
MKNAPPRRRLSVEELVASEKFAHMVTDASLNGLYICDLELGRNVYVNPEYTRLTGYSLEDFDALSTRQILELIHPQDRERVLTYLQRIYRGEFDGKEIEYRFKTKSGRWIWCLCRDAAFTRNEDGTVTQFIGFFLDVTERRQLEVETSQLTDAATREKDRLKALIKSIHDEIWLADNEGRFTLVNPSAAMEFDLNAPEMIDIREFARGLEVLREDGSRRPVDESPPLRALQGEVVRNEEEIIRTPATGEMRHRLVSAAPVRDAGGRIIGSVSVVRDITDRKATEKELRKINAELERRVQERTAEIKTQYGELEALNRQIKMLSWKTIEALETQRKALSKEIHDGVAGTLAAIKMLLEDRACRLAQGRESEAVPLDRIIGYLREAIKETKRISSQLRSLTLDDFGLKAALEEHMAHFRQFYPDIEVISHIDIAKGSIPPNVQTVLYRVTQEAMNNVGRHSGATRVNVNLRFCQDRICLDISDDGCGFELQPVLSGEDALSGFGIHSMRERVEICKGEFEIHSRAGAGTVIRISIPL